MNARQQSEEPPLLIPLWSWTAQPLLSKRLALANVHTQKLHTDMDHQRAAATLAAGGVGVGQAEAHRALASAKASSPFNGHVERSQSTQDPWASLACGTWSMQRT